MRRTGLGSGCARLLQSDSMNRAEALGILASLFLLAMAWLDHHWCWFWAASGAVMLGWYLWTLFFAHRSS